MPTERLNAEKEHSTPVNQSGAQDTRGSHERLQQDSKISTAALLLDRSFSNVGMRSKLGKFTRKKPEDLERKTQTLTHTQKQLQDYTAWVNNYLKRKPGATLIKDIRASFQDGISFVNLVEIVSRSEIQGVERYPISADFRRNNIERAVDFLKEDGVTLHVEAVRDILDGYSKGVMKVVLAIAERYQPKSVKPRSVSDPKPCSVYQHPSGSQLASNEASNKTNEGHVTADSNQLGDHVTRAHEASTNIGPFTRRRSSGMKSNSSSVPNINGLSGRLQGGGVGGFGSVGSLGGIGGQGSPEGVGGGGQQNHSQLLQYTTHPPAHHTVSSSSQPEKHFPSPDKHRGYPHANQSDHDNDMYSMPADHLPPTANTRIIAPLKKIGFQLKLRSGSNPIHSIPEDRELLEKRVSMRRGSMGGGSTTYSGSADSAVMLTEISDVLSGLTEFKTELLELHAALLRNSDGSETTTTQDTNVGVVSKSLNRPVYSHEVPIQDRPTATLADKDHLLSQKETEVLSLRDELGQLQTNNVQIESECAALRHMVDERNAFITTIKSEVYRKEYKNDTVKTDLHNQLLQKDTLIKKLEGDLRLCKESLEKHRTDLEETNLQLGQHKSTELELDAELEAIKTDLVRINLTEDALQSKLVSKEKKLTHLEEKLTDVQEMKAKRMEAISESTETIRERFVSLRKSLDAEDPQNDIVDSLERTVSELITKLMDFSSPSGKRSRKHRGESDDHQRDRDRDKRRRHRDKHSYPEVKLESGGTSYIVTPTNPSPPGPGTNPPSANSTKVFYYIVSDKTETPYVTLVPRKSDEVTLKDFKCVFDRPGEFSFFVKTEDPDCGVVKEEIVNEDLPLPSWKGKVLVWVSEDPRHR